MNTKNIHDAIYNMLVQANTRLVKEDFIKLSNTESKIKNEIIKNAYLAQKNNRPLCQDTGQVVVFLKVGQEVSLEGDFINDVINEAVRKCYTDNFYRKSVVKDALFDRTNTGDNTPCIIHTEFQKGDEISILIGIKGGGAENMTRLKMMNPTSTIEDVLAFVQETVNEAKDNACPPMIVGVGVGGTAEVAALYAKRALFEGKPLDFKAKNVVEAKIITGATHIASMPVCVNLNCHSIRHASCKIKNEKIYYDFEEYKVEDISLNSNAKKLDTKDIDEFKSLKTGDEILLTGTIYTARDMAHKRLCEMIENNQELPIELKNAIIFYAGPCPKTNLEIIGPIGPTTSKRMDKFAPVLYEKGILATIGKGERTIKGGKRIYLKAMGGVANIYKECTKKASLIAFEDLGSEAIYKLEVKDMPLTVEII